MRNNAHANYSQTFKNISVSSESSNFKLHIILMPSLCHSRSSVQSFPPYFGPQESSPNGLQQWVTLPFYFGWIHQMEYTCQIWRRQKSEVPPLLPLKKVGSNWRAGSNYHSLPKVTVAIKSFVHSFFHTPFSSLSLALSFSLSSLNHFILSLFGQK